MPEAALWPAPGDAAIDTIDACRDHVMQSLTEAKRTIADCRNVYGEWSLPSRSHIRVH